MAKISIIGAGSSVFAYEIMRDVLVTPGLDEGTFVLVDIDARRLELAHQIAEKLIAATGRRWNVEASTERTKVIAGTDYLINTIEVAGLENVRHDFDIPMKYGVNQCIGDTIGPGGIFKALRTLPSWLDILRDTERLAPDALVMNFTNPMSITCLTGVRASTLPIVGLCHSIPYTAEILAGYLGIPVNDLKYRAAGVNHLSWLVDLTYQGEDMYPRLRELMRDPAIYEQDPVRFEMMLYLGAFVTESSGHTSEYTPYFRKRPDLIDKYMRPEYLGETGFYANNWPHWRDESDEWISQNDRRGSAAGTGARRRICLVHHARHRNRYANRDLRQCAEYRTGHQSAAQWHHRDGLSRQPRWHPADLLWRAAAAACGARSDTHGGA